MKIYLLRVTDEQSVFYAEPVAAEVREMDAQAEAGGVRGWLSEKYAGFQRTLIESEGGLGRRMQRVWEWLQRRTAVDEQMMRSLRAAAEIKLHHPPSLSPAQAREAWQQYLASRRRYFLLWFLLNLLVTPITLVLAPVPGPNIIGWWFCYRAICHALSLLGIRRAGEVELSVHAASSLNVYLSEADEDQIAHLARELDLHGLSFYVARAAGRAARARDEKLAVS